MIFYNPFLSNIKLSGFLPLIFLLLFLSCRENKKDPVSYNKEIYTPEYSNNFKITGDENSDNTLITIFNPWQGAENISSNLFIQRDGEIPEFVEGEFLKGSANRIVCMSSTHIAMIDALGMAERIVGVSGSQYVSNPYIRKHLGEIKDVGYEGNMDYETLVSLKPDLVLLFSINGISALETKLKEFNIPFLYIGDYVEENPLGKAEWIVPLAEVLGIRGKGIEKFEDIENRYENIKLRLNQKESKDPVVMLNAPFADAWFMPSTESYVAFMVKDAGGEYAYKRNTGSTSMPVDKEEALLMASNSDCWINIGAIANYDEFKKTFPDFLNARCVKEGKLYNNNAKATIGGGNDCYESGVVNPDLVLRDMMKIFHPELVSEPFVYYKNLKEE